MTTTAFIGLGANLNNPAATLREAISEIAAISDTQLVAQSKLYSSTPMGPADQPDYINAVVAVSTSLSPHALFNHTCRIEQEHGRTRNGAHWGPRTLDLDLLLYGSERICDEQLTVPHYGLTQREFVIYPMLEIAPELILPCGTSLKELTHSVPLNGMRPID